MPADQNEFNLSVSFPFNAPPSELANVKLVATAQQVRAPRCVRTNCPWRVKIVPGGPPPALYRLFEDEPHFVALLNEGGGSARSKASIVTLAPRRSASRRSEVPALSCRDWA